MILCFVVLYCYFHIVLGDFNGGGDCIHILNVIRVRVELWMLAKLFYVY